MRACPSLVSFAVVCLGVASTAIAQQPDRELATDSILSAHGLSRSGDQWFGLGPSYRAEFGARGLAFSPVLGEHAEVDATWRFELEHVRRGEGAGVRAGASERQADADESTMRYVRPGVVETYQVREEGVELSFVFDDVPAGSGDLVVRGRIGTALPLVHAASDELRFESEWGGVRIGAVTGIDARGATARGSLRFVDGALEMVLPAAFVDAAEAPLVLDPLIETASSLVSQHARGFDVAYDSSSGIYLAVWQRTISAFDWDILGQRVLADGTPFGPTVRIDIGTNTRSLTPKVGVVRSRSAFVVAYLETLSPGVFDILVRSVDAIGEVSSPLSVGDPTVSRYLNDVSGNVTPGGDTVLLAYEERDSVEERVGLVSIQLDANGDLREADDSVLATSILTQYIGNTALPAHGGPDGRYLVTWTVRDILVSDDYVLGAVVDQDLGVLAPATTLTDIGGPAEEYLPALDGDGSQWLVAYSDSEWLAGRSDIGCVRVEFDDLAGSIGLGARRLIASTTANEYGHRVAYTGESYVVSYHTQQQIIPWCGAFATYGFADAHVLSLDPFTCQICEGAFQLQSAVGDVDALDLVVAGQWDGTAQSGAEALLLWGRTDTQGIPECTEDRSVRVQRFRPDDGIVSDLGGGCGGGEAFATCAVQGNAGFTLRVEGAAPAAPAFVALSGGQLNFPCGPCTIVADLGNGVAVGVGKTDANGDASAALPLPNLPTLVGVSLINQWLFIPPAGACFGVEMSNALQIVIE